jgi:hypothetical protein
MGLPPDQLTLDRYPDRNGNYEPGNCRWATRRMQRINSRQTVQWVILNGETMTLSDAAAKIGIWPSSIRNHAKKHGVTYQQAVDHLAQPYKRGPGRPRSRAIT